RPSLQAPAEVLTARLRRYGQRERRSAIEAAARGMTEAVVEAVHKMGTVEPLSAPEPLAPICSHGAARVYPAALELDPEAPAVLLVPSLINRPDILDLTETRSLLRALGRSGVAAYLLDWGDPGTEERRYDLGLYIEQRLIPVLDSVRAHHKDRPVALVGHCLGGTLALGAAHLAPERVASLSLIATPWDFAPLGQRAGLTPPRLELDRLITSCGAVFGGVPPGVLDALFFLHDPLQAMRKFPGFLEMSPQSERAQLFVTVERWLSTGARLSAPAARDLFIHWMLDNAASQGAWQIAERPVRPAEISTPALVFASRKDTLTPIESAVALVPPAAGALPNATLVEPRSGHIGMIVGARAERDLVLPLVKFLKETS
ncbi:MAG: alpha/beta fold hydrolase, partial [Pseudomonadota bacterium]